MGVMKILIYLKQFFSGFTRPLTWLETKTASAGLLTAIFFLLVIATVVVRYTGLSVPGGDTGNITDPSSANGNGSACNVVGIEIRDCIQTYKPDSTTSSSSSSSSNSCDVITSSEEVVGAIENARDNDSIKAVVLEIDSTGGMPVAAEEVAAALKGLGKPSIAWIRGSGDSAAYWIASAAGTIIAAKNSDVGGIGVTQSYVDNAKQNQRNGLTYNQLSTGPYKDAGNPDKPLTPSEKAYFERDLNIILNNFIQVVATNRHLSVDKVKSLADGSSMLGAMALQNGLIDRLGTKQQVWDELQKQIGEKPDVCW